jgi:hypothetical protein
MGWRGFGFVHHSKTILCRAVPNPNLTIRNFCIAVSPAPPPPAPARSPSGAPAAARPRWRPATAFRSAAARSAPAAHWRPPAPSPAARPAGTPRTRPRSAFSFSAAYRRRQGHTSQRRPRVTRVGTAQLLRPGLLPLSGRAHLAGELLRRRQRRLRVRAPNCVLVR